MEAYQFVQQIKTSAKKGFRSVSTLWLVFILVLSIYFPDHVFGQTTISDDKDMSINVTTYFFEYDMKFEDGSTAIGPTLSLNTNEKFWVQIGLLVDTRKYIYYEGGIMSSTAVEHINLFVPLTIQYNYFNSDKIELYLTAGFILGGRNIIGEYNNAEETSTFNLTFGTGIAYRPLSWLAIRAYPTIRYNLENFSPGVSVDVAYMFSSKMFVEM